MSIFRRCTTPVQLQTADETNGLDDRSAILCDLSLYDEKTGLSLKADSGQAFFG